eukprot:Hpha_TRINITY_DN6511_c0_g1::TRINITY_DN6511_c0_g1_i1::g.45891::m.45891
MPRKVALVGSSGGGSAHLGLGGDVLPLISHIEGGLRAIGAELTGVQMVAVEGPLDHATVETPAMLWYRRGDSAALQCVRGELASVNEMAVAEDAALADAVLDGTVDAVILVSADVSGAGVNSRVVAAAAAERIPCVGTGGSCLAAASAAGARVVGNSGGSVGTAPLLKALMFSVSLAREWRVPFRPAGFKGGIVGQMRSSLEGSLPVFLAAMLLRRALDLSPSVSPAMWKAAYAASAGAVPAAVGAASALSISGAGEPAALAGAAAGAMCAPSPFLAAATGAAVGRSVAVVVVSSIRAGLPATFTAILVGASGIAAGAFAGRLTAEAQVATEYGRALIRTCLTPSMGAPVWARAAAGAVMGLAFSRGSQSGLYHQLLLPGILLEMERADVPLLGAFDAVCLCATGAGVCAAQIVAPQRLALPRCRSGGSLASGNGELAGPRADSQILGERSLAVR